MNSALQRARATLATRVVDEGTPSLSDSQAAPLERYVELFERYDVDAHAALLREDAAFSMPQYPPSDRAGAIGASTSPSSARDTK